MSKEKKYVIHYNENGHKICPLCSGILITTADGYYKCHEGGTKFMELFMEVPKKEWVDWKGSVDSSYPPERIIRCGIEKLLREVEKREKLSRFNPENLSENRIRTKEQLERLEGVDPREGERSGREN